MSFPISWTPLTRAFPRHFKGIYDLYARNQADIESAYPDIRCNTAGYNLRGLVRDGRLDLTRLFAGAEGTLGIVTRLKFRLLPKPGHDALVVAFFTDILSSARAVQEILPLGPSGIEIMDKSLLNLAREHDPRLKDHIPDGIDNVLLIEFDSQTPEPCMDRCHQAQQILSCPRIHGKFPYRRHRPGKGKFLGRSKGRGPDSL